MEEAQCYGLLSGLMQTGNLTLNLPAQGILSLRNVRGKSTIKVMTSTKDEPYFLVTINVNGSLSDLANNHKELSPKDNRELELGIQKVLFKVVVKAKIERGGVLR
ncbi:MAG TPA: hypothetical protein DDW65_15670 [Firmicutes bacterium]|jgi:hypothetical protein|nr:hypothetical protein [Bacillota bacterium]